MKKQLIALGVCALAVVAVACSEDVDMGEFRPEAGPPSFTPDNDGGEGGLPNIPLTCMGTVCPDGYGTCLSGAVGAAPHKCGTDLRSDSANCGACGNKCPEYLPIHMTSRCVDSACEVQCYSRPGYGDWRNCNGKLADGCEIDISSDPNHCGVCGNACAAGERCNEGKCGCPAGQVDCNGLCRDLKTDTFACGACNYACWQHPVPGQCTKLPPGTIYKCEEGTCGHLRCQDEWIDCNNDLEREGCASDGCEAPAGNDNCGSCGNKCNAPEICITEGSDPHCGIPCVKYGKVLCGDECKDLLNDVNACGACGIFCPNPGPNSKRSCTKGVCGLECLEGWADCNGDPADGCEVDLRASPDHCGACGKQCNVAAGQPCIDGKCLMVDCTAEGAK